MVTDTDIIAEYHLYSSCRVAPMPAAVWNTLSEALKHVHRAFPVRAGIDPLNGGRSVVYGYAIDPNPFDPGFPAWGPLRLRFAEFNAAQQAQESARAARSYVIGQRVDSRGADVSRALCPQQKRTTALMMAMHENSSRLTRRKRC